MNMLNHGAKTGCLRRGVEGRNGYKIVNEHSQLASKTQESLLEEPDILSPRILRYSKPQIQVQRF